MRLILCPTDAALVCVQVLTGLGPVSQLSVTTGLPRIAMQLLLAAFVAHGLFGFIPGTPTWSSGNRNVRESCSRQLLARALQLADTAVP